MMRSYSFAVATAAFVRLLPRSRVLPSSRNSCRRHHTCITRPFITIERSSSVIIKYTKSRNNNQPSPSTRLFGSNPKSPNAKPGHIDLSDDRYPPNPTLIPIDLAALHRTIEMTREIIGYPTYDVSLCLVDDDYMTEINKSTRDMETPTDVLSFCFQETFIKPGVLGEVQFDISDYYNLGDMLIDVEYVKRKCDDDRETHAKKTNAGVLGGDDDNDDGMLEGEVLSETTNDRRSDAPNDDDSDDDDDQYEYEYMEVEVDEYDDRGVAPAMQYIYDPEIRIHMLVVHGMLHLVGYDHIEEDDYELMVVREDEVLAELKRRLGDNFGLNRGKTLSGGR